MRAYLAYAIMLSIVIIMAVQPAMAITQMAIPFVTTCDSIYMEPMEAADAMVMEFNNVNIAAASRETLDIDFPAFADGLHLGPVVATSGVAADGILAGSGATLNVLPFGPVDLAIPSIRQTADETCSYQRTYFYSDTGIV